MAPQHPDRQPGNRAHAARTPAGLLRRSAVQTAALALLLAAGAGPGLLRAQTPPPAPATAQTARAYDIPAGPLSPALSRFAGQAGVTLSADPALTEGLTTRGLQGRHGVLDGFARLLEGTGLVVGIAGDKAYVLRRAPASAAPAPGTATGHTLAAVTVTAQAERSATTEGTGTYAAQAATVFKGAKTLREIPQSVSVLTREQTGRWAGV